MRAAGLEVARLGSEKKTRSVTGGEAHQGIVAVVALHALMQEYDDFIGGLESGPDTVLVILDELKDPHNVGAIIRSAAALGAAGVLIPSRRQAPVTGTVIKVSAGMAFRVPLVETGNLNLTVRDLQKRGFRVFGFEADAKDSVWNEPFDGPSVLLMGSEGEGIRRRTGELCDRLLTIPIHPRAESLNVAASAAVALAAWSNRHPRALKR